VTPATSNVEVLSKLYTVSTRQLVKSLMTLAVMQPYVFPYIGYFQLIHSADKFVFLDDVSFIKQGWINRNRILVHGQVHTFSVPVVDASSHRKINQTKILHTNWQNKLIQTVSQSYKRAPQYQEVMPLVERVFTSRAVTISELAIESVESVCQYLSMSTSFARSSALYCDDHLRGQERILSICIQEAANVYVNAPGGRPLYSREVFSEKGVDLRFIRTLTSEYRQFSESFVNNLSMIDVLMFNDKVTTLSFLERFEIDV